MVSLRCAISSVAGYMLRLGNRGFVTRDTKYFRMLLNEINLFLPVSARWPCNGSFGFSTVIASPQAATTGNSKPLRTKASLTSVLKLISLNLPKDMMTSR